MLPTEEVDTYVASIQNLVDRLNKSGQDRMTAFVRGLPNHLRASYTRGFQVLGRSN